MQRRSRRRLLSWIPISIVALCCVGAIAAAVVMQNSWWTDENPVASDDQKASDGMSVFTDAGLAYLTRDGVVRIRLGEASLPADALGLEPDGTQSFEPIVPIEAIAVAPDGAIYIDLVRSFAVTTQGGRVTSTAFVREANGSWLAVIANLEQVAGFWGWTQADLENLTQDLTDASHVDEDEYSASLPPREHNGAVVSAEVAVDVARSEVTTTFTVSASVSG